VDAPRRNIEVKARDPDPARSLRVCLALGAKDEGWLRQRDTYLQVPSGRLKIREEGPHAQLIYYVRADAAAARESQYHLLDISCSPQLKSILVTALGTEVIVEKRRHLLLLGNVRVHLDGVHGLGDFIEIEAVADPASDLTDERQQVSQIQNELAITPVQIVAWSYSDALREQP
jgi:adenylate cyclase, class 2